MANMNVTYADMQQAAGRLNAGKDDIISKLHELQALVNNLVSSGFVTDSASGAFHESYQQFTTGTTQAVNGLDGMSQFLNKAADTLQQVDSQLAQGIGGH
ncbi:WXG100 family type VII secretion target [Microbacterium sp. ASV49]|uniref:WXG100 family type VII secretion target n=1 Tax=Microbacterium candidum TaxID=3041922 RepID=A0ABT7MUT3_9MICO|nr:WXG100 family type VII secretion target [Microbacterium sp. ASV49]MDL9978212.1 WXG100 family type VII secretion target [Microbacterium sp. ASV49]